MIKSKYNYIVKYSETQYILFNTLNTTLLLLDEDHYHAYLESTCFDIKNSDNYVLYQNGMIVDDFMDEKAIVDFDRGQLAYNKGKRLFRILTTTACNARCYYCYEAGSKVISMDMQTADDVVCYIKRQTTDVDEFIITWFGGEPLLNYSAIDYISEKLKSYAAETDKKWSANIVTNGSLFTANLISLAKNKWNISNVQITLDGTKRFYEIAKSYVDSSTFEDVIKHIKELCNAGIQTSIRINYNDKNYEDVKSLIAYLGTELKMFEHWAMYVYPIFSNIDGSYNEIYVQKLIDLEKIIAQVTHKAENDIISLPKYLHGRCVYCSIAGETILPNGDLMKCCRHMNKERPFANIKDRKINYNSLYAQWCTPVLPDKCNHCVLLPICQGGCKAEQLIGQAGCLPKTKVIDQVLVNYVSNLLNISPES